MQWDPDILEAEIRNCDYFRHHSFSFVERRDVIRAGSQTDAYEFRLENADTQRGVEVTFDAPRPNGLPGVFQVYLLNLANDGDFNLEEYLRQHHSVNLDRGFRTDEYSGSVHERTRAFLNFVIDLLIKYAEQILQGRQWPEVHFDWGGTR